MLFTTDTITNKEIDSISKFFDEFETAAPAAEDVESSVAKYIHSLVTSCYQKSVDDIANTRVGNKLHRKRNLQQVMRESFFYGSNRFGQNFIA